MAENVRRACIARVVLLTPVIVMLFGSGRAADGVKTHAVDVRTRDELRRAIAAAEPGAIIRIAPGTYRGGLSFENVHGVPARPIVICALDEQRPPVIQGEGAGLHLRDPAHVELRNLIIEGAEGNGLNIDNGGRADGAAHHIVVSNVAIRGIGPRGNCDGLKLSGVDDFLVQDCSFQHWGDGGSAIDMVGCHRGEIRGCRFQHERGDNGASGVQAKGGSAQIAVRHCRFVNAGSRAVNIGGSTGLEFFRPTSANYEAQDITVEDCTFVGSMAPIAFVGVDGALVRYNTIYGPARWVVRILQETTGQRFVPCRNGQFTNNVIAFRSDQLRAAVNVGSGTLPETFTFADNHWYCLDNPARSRPDLPVAETRGHYGQHPRFVNEGQHSVMLAPDSPIQDAGPRPAD